MVQLGSMVAQIAISANLVVLVNIRLITYIARVTAHGWVQSNIDHVGSQEIRISFDLYPYAKKKKMALMSMSTRYIAASLVYSVDIMWTNSCLLALNFY